MSAADGLFALLGDAVSDLARVEPRKMFGCNCLFTDGKRSEGKIFALVWKEGRIALKLPVSAGELLLQRGARPWTIGRKKMGAWVLTPESFHDDAELLRHWARRAHTEVILAASDAVAKRPSARARKPSRITGDAT